MLGKIGRRSLFDIPKMYEKHDTELNKSQNLPLKRKVYSNNPIYIWHLRLGHINLEMIDRLVKEDHLYSLTFQPLPACTSCLEEKMTRMPFSAKDNKFKDVLELINTNVCGLLNIRVRRGFEYFITFTDDYSRYDYLYLLYRNSEAFENFKEFWAKAEK